MFRIDAPAPCGCNPVWVEGPGGPKAKCQCPGEAHETASKDDAQEDAVAAVRAARKRLDDEDRRLAAEMRGTATDAQAEMVERGRNAWRPKSA